jgi:hypothetical protein
VRHGKKNQSVSTGELVIGLAVTFVGFIIVQILGAPDKWIAAICNRSDVRRNDLLFQR